MNKTSSRSHAVLQISIEQIWAEINNDEKQKHYKKGLLTIVDLAGSERISKTGSEGIKLEEAKKINMSISALGNVINSLANNKNLQHVPFRSSKLTRLLTECLGGNSKTAICACVSPFLLNYDETLTTLQFASRAIKIRVDPHINEKVDNRKVQNITEYKKIDSLIIEKKKQEKDINDLKNKYMNLKKSNNESEQSTTYPNQGESENMIKKFQMMIIHLQNELARSVK
jgi:hypothetical protein